jgi:RHS repeat-associated protein
LISKAEINGPSIPSASQIENKAVKYTYDINDSVTSIMYPETGSKVKGLKFEYDNNKWLTEIITVLSDSEETIREYTYDSLGQVDQIINNVDFDEDSDNQTIREHKYDAFSRPTEITYHDNKSSAGAIQESYEYSYDKNNNILTESLSNYYPSEDVDKVDQTRTYEYDLLGRLDSTEIVGKGIEDNLSSSIDYSYDAVGNMIGETKDGTVTSNTYNSLNQLKSSVTTTSDGAITTTSYNYDRYGNQISESKTIPGKANGIKNMVYDVDNRLTEVNYAGGYSTDNPARQTQRNSYNGQGQRIQKIVGSDTTNYYYQGTSVLYTTDVQDSTTALNLLGTNGQVISTMRPNTPIDDVGTGPDDGEIDIIPTTESAVEEPGDGTDTPTEDYFFYHKDVRESTTNLMSDKLDSMVSYEYSDFGETITKGDTDFYNEISYTSGVYDEDTGLYYLNARFYNPADARFLTMDTYRGENTNPSSLHLYAYCANNPINFIDPTGHWSKNIHKLITERSLSRINNTKKLNGVSLKSGSIWPDNNKPGVPRFHGKHSTYTKTKNYRIKLAKRKYGNKNYKEASKQLGIALHTQQDYYAHNITVISIKGNATIFHKAYDYKSGETHGNTFDNVNKKFNGYEWIKDKKKSRYKNAISKTTKVIKDFLNGL